MLLEAGADPNAIDKNGQSPLIYVSNRAKYAHSKGNSSRLVDTISNLAKAGANMNAIDRNGRTALSYAAAHEAGLSLLRPLLREGALPDIIDNKRRAPLHHAIHAGLNPTELLIKLGARADLQDVDGEIPLDLARESGDEKLKTYMAAIKEGSGVKRDLPSSEFLGRMRYD